MRGISHRKPCSWPEDRFIARSRLATWAVVLVALAAASPATALASTATISAGTLVYTASAGEANDVHIELRDSGSSAAYHLIDADAVITAGAGCTPVSAHEVACGSPSAATLN